MKKLETKKKIIGNWKLQISQKIITGSNIDNYSTVKCVLQEIISVVQNKYKLFGFQLINFNIFRMILVKISINKYLITCKSLWMIWKF